MSLARVIRNAIKVADQITGSLQVPVQHAAWVSDGSTYSDPQYGPPIVRLAIVEMKERLRHLGGGQEVLQKASVTFLRPIPPNGATDRREPIDPRDQITLPSGYTGPILNVEGMDNPDTSAPYMIEVILG